METYRKINQWTSHSRDMVESFKRYYNNSFLDGQRQEAYNLFLGNYIFVQGQPMLWDLSTDYYLHHSDPRMWSARRRRSYINWFTPKNLDTRSLPTMPQITGQSSKMSLENLDNYWLEYYRPLALSSFQKIFSYRMNSTLGYIPFKSTQEGKYDLSPFRVRSGTEYETPEKSRHGRNNAIEDLPAGHSRHHRRDDSSDFSSIGAAAPLDMPVLISSKTRSISSDIPKLSYLELQETVQSQDQGLKPAKSRKDKTAFAQWTLNQFVINSLDPSVKPAEMEEYGRYISHPLNLPLVVSSEAPPTPSPDFIGYIRSAMAVSLSGLHSTEEDVTDYMEFLDVGDDPLTVTEADTPKKRYKAYRQWLKGKSLFKQSRIDP